MSLGALVPKDIANRKPAHGQPCNRCGGCCYATLCTLAQAVFKRGLTGPCPALTFDEQHQSSCGLVAEPMKHARAVALRHGVEAASAAARQLIGAGTGCDARVNGEPGDEVFYSWQREHARRTQSQTNRARKIWGV